MMLFLLFLCFSAVLSQYCPRDHELYDEGSKKCYYYNPSAANFTIALRSCRDIGYDLISIHNAFQNQIVDSFAQQFFEDEMNFYWVGASGQYLNYTWSDQSKFNFSNWAIGEPMDDRFCVAVQVADAKWHTKQCSLRQPFVCAGPPSGGDFSTTVNPNCLPREEKVCDCSSACKSEKKSASIFDFLRKQ